MLETRLLNTSKGGAKRSYGAAHQRVGFVQSVNVSSAMSSLFNPTRSNCGVVGPRCDTERAGRLRVQSKRLRRHNTAAKAFPDGKGRVLSAWTGILGKREGLTWQRETDEQANRHEPEGFTKDTSHAAAETRKDESTQRDPVFGTWKIPHGMRFFFKHELVTEGVFSPVLISIGTSLPLLFMGFLLWPQIFEKLSALPEFLAHAKL